MFQINILECSGTYIYQLKKFLFHLSIILLSRIYLVLIKKQYLFLIIFSIIQPPHIIKICWASGIKCWDWWTNTTPLSFCTLDKECLKSIHAYSLLAPQTYTYTTCMHTQESSLNEIRICNRVMMTTGTLQQWN